MWLWSYASNICPIEMKGQRTLLIRSAIYMANTRTLRPSPHRAETGENNPISFYAVQGCLCKDGVISKPHRAVWYMIWTLFVSSAEIRLATQQPLHVKTENMNYTHWHDTLKHNKFTYMGTDSREHIVHHFAFLRFSIKVDWWTKYFFSLTFLKSGTSYLLPIGRKA